MSQQRQRLVVALRLHSQALYFRFERHLGGGCGGQQLFVLIQMDGGEGGGLYVNGESVGREGGREDLRWKVKVTIQEGVGHLGISSSPF